MKQEHLLAETLVPFDAGKKLLGKPTRSQLCYWRSTGLKVSGQPKRVRLECLRIGGRPFTSLKAYLRFLEKINK